MKQTSDFNSNLQGHRTERSGVYLYAAQVDAEICEGTGDVSVLCFACVWRYFADIATYLGRYVPGIMNLVRGCDSNRAVGTGM